MDTSVGANPFWHSCILLSKMDEATKKLEVVDTWGFYGLPSTDKSNSWTRALKLKLGLDVDLQGNHGMLRHEDTRFLDQGKGLHGTTFEVTEDQFNRLALNCRTMVQEQEEAIAEAVKALGDPPPKSKEQTRIYPHEDYSALIFAMEKVKANQLGRPSRLKPFEFRAFLGLGGPCLRDSQTCKSQVVGLLATVLSEAQIARLTVNGKHPSVPRLSGDMEDILLHSTGPLLAHTKRSGDKVYFRDLINDVIRVFWTIPPQKCDTLSDETTALFNLDPEYRGEARALVRKLQGLEWALRNTSIPKEHEAVKERLSKYKEQLINSVINCYQAFALMSPKSNAPKASGLTGFALSLFFQPRSTEEFELMEKIKKAKLLLNSVYMSMVDEWAIQDIEQMEPDETSAEQQTDSDPSEKTSTQSAEDLDNDCNEPEVYAAYLSIQDKKALCKVLGRNYTDSWVNLEHLDSDEEPAAVASM